MRRVETNNSLSMSNHCQDVEKLHLNIAKKRVNLELKTIILN